MADGTLAQGDLAAHGSRDDTLRRDYRDLQGKEERGRETMKPNRDSIEYLHGYDMMDTRLMNEKLDKERLAFDRAGLIIGGLALMLWGLLAILHIV